MTDSYFNEKKVKELTEQRNWELIPYGKLYYLRQKDRTYMTTVYFEMDDEVAKKFMQ